MVHIVTGEIDQGKTSKILSLYNARKTGDGFITRKVFKGGLFVGFEIVRLSRMESMPFIYLRGYEPNDWDEGIKNRRFSFSKKAFLFAESIIDEALRNGANPIFIDEIGPLELNRQGFSDLFKRVLAAKRDVYVAVRGSCVENVLTEFEIEEYEIVKI